MTAYEPKGKWEAMYVAAEGKGRYEVLEGERLEPIAIIPRGSNERDIARLIAAAPELLKALEFMKAKRRDQ